MPRNHKLFCPLLLLSCAPSCLILCDPMDCSPPGSSVHGILQARILELGAVPSPRGSSQPRAPTRAPPALAGGFFTTAPSRKPFLSSICTQLEISSGTTLTYIFPDLISPLCPWYNHSQLRSVTLNANLFQSDWY